MKRNNSLIKRFIPYFYPYKHLLFFDLFCAALTTVCELVLPMILRYITNQGLEDLAALCGISDSYLKKLFHKKFGMPTSKYIISLRIHYACDLLQTEHYTTSKVAELCGYSDIYFFSRQFKRYMGISPTQFVKKYRSSK